MKPINVFITIGAFALLFVFFGAGFSLLPNFEASPLASFVILNREPDDQDTSIKALYITSRSAAREQKIKEVIQLINDTELNAIVIDIKDSQGFIVYDANHPAAEANDTIFVTVPELPALLERLHNEEIYTIARLPVFQDTALAEARPDLAIHSESRGNLWRDYNNIAWLDPASLEVWNYTVELIRSANDIGFDEINLDYIRFPSDGNMNDTDYPFWDEETPMHTVIGDFMRYVRKELPEATLSVDLFGLTTSHIDDLGIGQIIEDAFATFNYVAPMMYPSHYPTGYLGFANPAEHPGDIIRQATRDGLRRLYDYHDPSRGGVLRPWLQDFNLGAIYDAPMVRAQIDALYGAFDHTPYDPVTNGVNGFMLWNASNNYTKEALEPAQ